MEAGDISSLPFLTRKMLNFESGAVLSLVVETISVNAGNWAIRGLTKEGPFSSIITPGFAGTIGTTIVQLSDIPILFTVVAVNTNEAVNQINITVSLAVNGVKYVILAQGNPNGVNGLSWPYDSAPTALQQRGQWVNNVPSNPAAGAEIADTIAYNQLWRMKSIEFTLTTSATVATRHVTLKFTVAGGTALLIPQAIDQTASLVKTYIFYPGAAAINQATTNQIVTPLPDDLWLQAATVIGTATTAIQVGDQFSAIRYHHERYLSPF